MEKVVDARIVEACLAQGHDPNKLTPAERFEYYLRYNGPSITNWNGWGNVLIGVMQGAGFTIRS